LKGRSILGALILSRKSRRNTAWKPSSEYFRQMKTILRLQPIAQPASCQLKKVFPVDEGGQVHGCRYPVGLYGMGVHRKRSSRAVAGWEIPLSFISADPSFPLSGPSRPPSCLVSCVFLPAVFSLDIQLPLGIFSTRPKASSYQTKLKNIRTPSLINSLIIE